MKVKGTFKVDLNPTEAYADGAADNQFARMTIDKTFEGTLSATSKGEMLSVMTGVQGSAGYVALEQVQGSLDGKAGGFVLQHFGTMDKGKDRLVLEVIPDSGTDALSGISGSMQIDIVDGQHFYEFDFELQP